MPDQAFAGEKIVGPVTAPDDVLRVEHIAKSFGPTQALDIECEVGFVCGPGVEGPVPIDEAEGRLFGVTLVNDWSARDIQRFEGQPLGPFLSKAFATTISAWVVPVAALEEVRVPGPRQDPEPLPYLRSPGDWALDIHLEVHLQSATMDRPHVICRSNMKSSASSRTVLSFSNIWKIAWIKMAALIA